MCSVRLPEFELQAAGRSFKCALSPGRPRPTVPRAKQCDGVSDCPFAEDEDPALCGMLIAWPKHSPFRAAFASRSSNRDTWPLWYVNIAGGCPVRYIGCDGTPGAWSFKCIHEEQLCDGVPQCVDLSDELNCFHFTDPFVPPATGQRIWWVAFRVHCAVQLAHSESSRNLSPKSRVQRIIWPKALHSFAGKASAFGASRRSGRQIWITCGKRGSTPKCCRVSPSLPDGVLLTKCSGRLQFSSAHTSIFHVLKWATTTSYETTSTPEQSAGSSYGVFIQIHILYCTGCYSLDDWFKQSGQ